jgi:hypothetical protein
MLFPRIDMIWSFDILKEDSMSSLVLQLHPLLMRSVKQVFTRVLQSHTHKVKV